MAFALGVERTFQPGSDAPTTVWVVLAFALGLMEAAKNAEKPVWVMAGNVVLGIAGVLLGASKAASGRRSTA